MNKEILKAIKDKQKKHPFRDWWNSNESLKARRVIFFPIWIYVEISERIKSWNYERIAWDEKRADEILTYYIPRTSDWNPDKKTFFFYDNGMGWSIGLAKRYLKIKDRAFWRKFRWDIEEYLNNKFELEGFEKEVISTRSYYTGTEIIFTQKS